MKGELQETKDLVATLLKEIDNIKLCLHSTTHTNIGTQNNYTQINMNAFGQENLEHITKELKKSHIMNLRDSIPSIIKSIHFNLEAPENCNIRQLSNKQHKLQFYDGVNWLPCDRSNTLDRLIEKGHKILYSFFLENQLSDNDLKLRAQTIMEYYQLIGLFKEKKEYQNVKRELYMLFCQDNAIFVLDNTLGSL